jgi:anaerobic magnesium-protoporphyrin IX monomethyl ester cyclase
MSHITLIRPSTVASKFAYSVGIVPPLGPAYLAASLLRGGHEVAVIDAVGEAPLQKISGGHPDLVAYGLSIDEIVRRMPGTTDGVALSVMFSQQWPLVRQLVEAVHAERPNTPIIVGGEHVVGTWRAILEQCPAVTACAFGEGEETIVEFAGYLEGRMALGAIAGIAYRDEGLFVRTRPRERIEHIDDIPRPAWHLFPLETYLAAGFGHGTGAKRSVPMLATRGCPYQCTFCSSPAMWTTRYIARSATDVVDEIEEHVSNYGATNIDFCDLTAVIKRTWILELCAELERRSVRITYQLPSGTRSEALDHEVLAALYRTGCRNICYAPESGSENTLDRIKKRVVLDRLVESVIAAKHVGIKVKTNLMIGFPDETRADLWKTLRFGAKLVWLGADDVPLFPFSPYPGSQLYEELRANGTLPAMDDDYFASLSYMDITSARSVSRHVGDTELVVTRFVGMSALIALGYLRRPRRVPRTALNLLTGTSETNLELRLNELRKRTLRAALPRRTRGSAQAMAPFGPAADTPHVEPVT